MDIIAEFVNRMPARRKHTPSGWTSVNAPCCSNRGHKPDKRSRGGYKISSDSISFSCFNCSFKASWQVSRPLSKNAKLLLKYLGATTDEIKKINFECLKLKNSSITVNNITQTPEKKISLPEGSKLFSEWVDDPSEDFLKVLAYINDRNSDLLKWHEYYWSPNKKEGMNKRIIIPFTSNNGWINGYSARSIDEKIQPKYMAQVVNNSYLFNQDKLYSPNRKFVIVCEGVFDAISLDCIAVMKQYLTDRQIETLRTISEDKKIIIVPDRDASGKQLVEQAIKLGYSVSMPNWGEGIKDIADAVKEYGRIVALQQILQSVEDTELKIKLKMKGWF